MSTTPTTPKPAGPATAPVRAPRRPAPGPTLTRSRPRAVVREHGFVLAIAAALALASLSLLYPSTPSYDPWAWIQWGRDILQFELNTDTGPSWKPLPVMFATVFAVFGAAAPDLLLV